MLQPPERAQPAVPAGAALATWAAAWPLAMVFVAQLVLLALGAEAGDLTTAETCAVTATGWIVFLAALGFVSRSAGTGDLRADYGVRLRPVDLVGLPVGVALQFVAVPALYWPLEQLWPGTFGSDEVEERANELVDRAHGGWIWVLAAVVVLGAPIVEELVYRGLLQRSLGGRIGRWWALAVVALWFALIHFSPVEIPGLFLAGATFGLGVALTGRIGPGLAAHIGFNAAGFAVVLWW